MDTPNRRTNTPQESPGLEDASLAAQEKLDQMSEQIETHTQKLQAGVAAASEAAQNFLQATGEQFTECARSTDQAIRKHPYESLGIALGAGIVVGYLLARK